MLAYNIKLNDVSMSFSNCYKLIYIFFFIIHCYIKKYSYICKQLNFTL